MPKVFVSCPNCLGRGSMDGHGEITCLECTGSGRVTAEAARMLRLTGQNTITMRLARNHRKRGRLETEIPAARFLIDDGRAWLYQVPTADVAHARAIGLTVAREQ